MRIVLTSTLLVIGLALAVTSALSPVSAASNAVAPPKQVHFKVLCVPDSPHTYCNVALPSVPADRRLFVDHISVRLSVPPATSPGQVFLRDQRGSDLLNDVWDYVLPVVYQSKEINNRDLYTGSHQLGIFIDPSDYAPEVWVSNVDTNSAAWVIVTGYYAPLP